jgi:hypothetical protein
MRPTDRRGFMSEWTVPFGLSLKMTKGRFGARDGKQRNPVAPRPELGGSAEVIDLGDALAAPAVINAATEPASRQREVLHA